MRGGEKVKKIPDTTPTKNLPRYAYIDALRGIAIILVLLAHTSHFSNITYPSWLENFASIYVGPRGVQLFFIVSAVTLCMSFSNRRNIEKHPIRNFYIRRFFRIAPLFYLAILFYLWQAQYWNGNPYHFSLPNILTTFTFTNGISYQWMNNIVFGGWSIAVEMTYYLIFPILFYTMRNVKFAALTTIGMGIMMQLLRLFILTIPIVATNPDIQTYTFEFFPSQLPVFLIGMTLYLLMHEEVFQKNKKTIVLILFFIGILVIPQTFFPLKIISGHYIYAIIFAALLFILAKRPYRILVNPLTVFIGKISFGLYLSHMGVYALISGAGLSQYLPGEPYLNFIFRFLVLSGLSVVVATILFYTVETGGILLGKKLINRNEKTTPSSVNSSARTW